MTPVAIRAYCGLLVAEQVGLAVVTVEEGRLLAAVAARAHRHLARAELRRAGRKDVVRVVAVGAERRLTAVLGERQGSVEGALVHETLLAVAVAASVDLGRPEPILGDALRVHAGVEADVAADARQLAVTGVCLVRPVNVDALLLAVDVDVRRHLLAVDLDVAVLRLLPMAREAGLVLIRAQRRARRRRTRGRSDAGERGEAADHGDAGERQRPRRAANRHGVTPFCSWHASHMPCG